MMLADFRGVVVAAGRGSRLGSIARDRPKCLTTLGGRTLLARQLETLKAQGVNETLVVGGYRRETLPSGDYRLVENQAWATTSMLDSIVLALETPTDRSGSLLIYGDVFVHKESLNGFSYSTQDVVVGYTTGWRANWSGRYANPLDDLETFRLAPDHTVIDIGGKPSSIDDIEGQFAGMLALTTCGAKTVLSECQTGSASSTTEMLANLIRDGIQVGSCRVPEPWFEIDTPADLAFAERALKEWSS